MHIIFLSKINKKTQIKNIYIEILFLEILNILLIINYLLSFPDFSPVEV